MDAITVGGALSSFKTLTDIAQSFLQVRDTTLIQGKVVELQSAIIGAQNETMAIQAAQAPLLARVDKLEKEIVRFKDWEGEKQRYHLKELVVGVLAYAMKSEAANSEPPHYICPNCYNQGKKSILQRTVPGSVRTLSLKCPDCRVELMIAGPGVRYLTDADGKAIAP